MTSCYFYFTLTIICLCSTVARSDPRVLVLTKSQGYEHSTVVRNNGQPSFLEQIMVSLAAQNGFTVSFSDLFCFFVYFEKAIITTSLVTNYYRTILLRDIKIGLKHSTNLFLIGNEH